MVWGLTDSSESHLISPRECYCPRVKPLGSSLLKNKLLRKSGTRHLSPSPTSLIMISFTDFLFANLRLTIPDASGSLAQIEICLGPVLQDLHILQT